MLLIVCGVSGSGKTTIGKLLSEALEIPFYDADDFHPASNIQKMANGIPLDDKDRQPWLEALAGSLSAWEKEGDAVLACPGLKESHRKALGSQCSKDIRWIILQASEAVNRDRLEQRKEHFFDRQLLRSQLDIFEKPDYGWRVDADPAPQEIVTNILERLQNA